MGQNFKIDVFSGMTPKVADHLLDANESSIAENCKLVSGELRSWRGDSLVTEKVRSGTTASILKYNNFWHTFTDEVSWAKAPVIGDQYDRIVITGRGVPEVTDTTLVTSSTFDSYILGVPAPTQAPTVVASGSTGGTLTDTYWVYTYVRKWADGKVDEGPPSPVSNLLALDSAGTADLTALADLTDYADYGVTHKYIYRTQTGSTSAEFQFVKEIAIGTTSTTDDVAGDELGEVLSSSSWGPPPDDLDGIVNLGNGIMAGFVDNIVYLSDVFQAHGWSEANSFPVEYTIVGLGVFNNMLMVMTTGYPLSVYVASPTQYQVTPFKELLPCASKRSIVSTKFGVIYASDVGLVNITQQGPESITAALFADLQWSDLNPESIIGMFHDNQYFWFWQREVPYVDEFGDIQYRTEYGSYILNMVDSNAGLSTTNIPYGPMELVVEDHAIYYATDTVYTTEIYKWEGSTVKSKNFSWKSKEFISTMGDINLSAARVLAHFVGTTIDEETAMEIENEFEMLLDEGLFGAYAQSSYNTYSINGDRLIEISQFYSEPKALYFALYVDGFRKFIKQVTSDKLFRLPTGLKGRKFYIELFGNIDVRQVQVATSAQELI